VVRVGFRVMEKEKVRVCLKCRKEIDTNKWTGKNW
jgi:hypothetical protein